MKRTLLIGCLLLVFAGTGIAQQTGTITGDRVRVRNKPTTTNSETVGHVNKGDNVTILDKTSKKDKIASMEDYWYRIEFNEGKKGWAFGYFVKLEKTEIKINILQPNPVAAMAKAENYICATMGNEVIELNTENGNISKIYTGESIIEILSLEKAIWVLMSENKIFLWDSKKNVLSQIYSTKSTILSGTTYNKEIYFFSHYVTQKGKYKTSNKRVITCLNAKGEIKKKISTWSTVNTMDSLHNAIIAFGNGTEIYKLEEQSKAIRPLDNYWANRGMSISDNMFICGGGGWAPVISKWPLEDKVIVLERKKHSNYDSVHLFDVYNENYWMLAKLAGEGARHTGSSIIQSYPDGKTIIPPKCIVNDFLVTNNSIYLATQHGLLEISTLNGECYLYTRGSTVKEFDDLILSNINWEPVITNSISDSGRTIAIGYSVSGIVNNTSFILENNTRGQWIYKQIPIEGLKHIVRYADNKYILGGSYAIYDEDSALMSGGLCSYNNKSGKVNIIHNMPVSYMKANNQILDTVYYTTDEFGKKYKVKEQAYDIVSLKELNKKEYELDLENDKDKSKFLKLQQNEFPYFENSEIFKINYNNPIRRIKLNYVANIANETIGAKEVTRANIKNK